MDTPLLLGSGKAFVVGFSGDPLPIRMEQGISRGWCGQYPQDNQDE
jgi:hypothetical protein